MYQYQPDKETGVATFPRFFVDLLTPTTMDRLLDLSTFGELRSSRDGSEVFLKMMAVYLYKLEPLSPLPMRKAAANRKMEIQQLTSRMRRAIDWTRSHEYTLVRMKNHIAVELLLSLFTRDISRVTDKLEGILTHSLTHPTTTTELNVSLCAKVKSARAMRRERTLAVWKSRCYSPRYCSFNTLGRI